MALSKREFVFIVKGVLLKRAIDEEARWEQLFDGLMSRDPQRNTTPRRALGFPSTASTTPVTTKDYGALAHILRR